MKISFQDAISTSLSTKSCSKMLESDVCRACSSDGLGVAAVHIIKTAPAPSRTILLFKFNKSDDYCDAGMRKAG